jgi:hypothetical protein
VIRIVATVMLKGPRGLGMCLKTIQEILVIIKGESLVKEINVKWCVFE